MINKNCGYHGGTIVSCTADDRRLNWKLHIPHTSRPHPLLVVVSDLNSNFPCNGYPDFANDVLRSGCAIIRGNVLPRQRGKDIIDTTVWTPSYAVQSIRGLMTCLKRTRDDIDLKRVLIYASGINALPAMAAMQASKSEEGLVPAGIILSSPLMDLQGLLAPYDVGLSGVFWHMRPRQIDVMGEKHRLSRKALLEARAINVSDVIHHVQGRVLLLNGRKNSYVSSEAVTALGREIAAANPGGRRHVRTVLIQDADHLWRDVIAERKMNALPEKDRPEYARRHWRELTLTPQVTTNILCFMRETGICLGNQVPHVTVRRDVGYDRAGLLHRHERSMAEEARWLAPTGQRDAHLPEKCAVYQAA